MPPRKLREPIENVMGEIAKRLSSLVRPREAAHMIYRTSRTGNEEDVWGTIDADTNRRSSRIQGNDHSVLIPQDEYNSRIQEMFRPGANSVSVHTHPPDSLPIPSDPDGYYWRGHLSSINPNYLTHPSIANDPNFENNNSMFGILGTGTGESGGAYGLTITGRVPENLVHRLQRSDPRHHKDFADLVSKLRFSGPIGREFYDRPEVQRLNDIGSLRSILEHLKLTSEFPDTINVGVRTSMPEVQKTFNELYDYLVNTNGVPRFAEGGLVENENGTVTYEGDRRMRYNHPLARRSLNEAHQVNPRFAERRLREAVEEANNLPSYQSFEEFIPTWHEVGTELIGMIPGGETGMYLGGREGDGVAPTLPHAIARDAVNVATLPMGFLRAMAVGIPSDVAADTLLNLINNRSARARSLERTRSEHSRPGQLNNRSISDIEKFFQSTGPNQ